MIYKDRMTARMDGDFVVFLIGMRINKPLAFHKYLPVLSAMPKMLTELYTKPELGLIHHEMWLRSNCFTLDLSHVIGVRHDFTRL